MLHKGMTKSQDMAIIPHPSNSANGTNIHITPDQGNTDGTSRFESHTGKSISPCRYGITCKTKGFQVLVEVMKSIFRKPTDHEGRAFCREALKDGRTRIRFLKHIEHLANGGQKAVVRV